MSTMTSSRLRQLLAALLVLGAALFVVGVAVERHGAHHDEPAAAAPASQETGDEAAERASTSAAAKAAAAETGNEAAERAATSVAGHTETAAEQAANGESGASGESGERLLGVNVESTPLVIVAVIVALALAAAVLRWPRRPVFVVVAALAALWTAADIAEVIHQHREGRGGVAALAGVIAALHVVVGLLALAQLTGASQRSTPAVAAR